MSSSWTGGITVAHNPLTQAPMPDLQPSESAASSPDSRRRLRHGDLVVDLAAFAARWQGRVISLRPNEFRLLAHFVAHPDRVFSRADLIASLGKDGDLLDERTVDLWTGRLRRALREHGVPDPLRTVRTVGYVLDSIEG